MHDKKSSSGFVLHFDSIVTFGGCHNVFPLKPSLPDIINCPINLIVVGSHNPQYCRFDDVIDLQYMLSKFTLSPEVDLWSINFSHLNQESLVFV